MSAGNHSVKSRDIGLDGLRIIGLLAIILAHVNPPDVLFQIRNFDVPLMVFISGVVYQMSSGTNKPYLSYIWSRVKRLLLPTWTFLILYYLIIACISVLSYTAFPYSVETMLSSFALLEGFGYVWIIRVFILVALIAPLFIYLSKQIKSRYLYGGLLLVLYIVYEVAYNMIGTVGGYFSFLFTDILYYLMPYGIITGLAILAAKVAKKYVVLLGTMFICTYIVIAYASAQPDYVSTQIAKYPPTLYYVSYAMGVSFVLFAISKTSVFQKMFDKPLLLFISASSLWIYLWHILYLYLWKLYVPSSISFTIQFFIVLTLAIATTYLQKKCIRVIIDKVTNSYVRAWLSDALLK